MMSANIPVYVNVWSGFCNLNALRWGLNFVRGDFCFSVASVARAKPSAASVVLMIVLLPKYYYKASTVMCLSSLTRKGYVVDRFY